MSRDSEFALGGKNTYGWRTFHFFTLYLSCSYRAQRFAFRLSRRGVPCASVVSVLVCKKQCNFLINVLQWINWRLVTLRVLVAKELSSQLTKITTIAHRKTRMELRHTVRTISDDESVFKIEGSNSQESQNHKSHAHACTHTRKSSGLRSLF